MSNPKRFKGVKVYNRNHLRNLTKGGYVYPKSNMSKAQLNNDSVLTILRPNELVIPVNHHGIPLAKQIIKHLKSQNIYLPYMT